MSRSRLTLASNTQVACYDTQVTELIAAAQHGEINKIRELFASMSVDVRGSKFCALGKAAYFNQLPAVQCIIELLPVSQHCNDTITDALRIATVFQHWDIITYLGTLDKDKKPNEKSLVEAICCAACAQKVPVVAALLRGIHDKTAHDSAVISVIKEIVDINQTDPAVLQYLLQQNPPKDAIQAILDEIVLNVSYHNLLKTYSQRPSPETVTGGSALFDTRQDTTEDIDTGFLRRVRYD